MTTLRCTNPLCGRELRSRDKREDGYCATCRRNWAALSYPADGPGPPGPLREDRARAHAARQERIAEAARLACAGVPEDEICARVGVTNRTLRRYLADYRANGGVIIVDLQAGTEQMRTAQGPRPAEPEMPDEVLSINGRPLGDGEAHIITQAREDARRADAVMLQGVAMRGAA